MMVVVALEKPFRRLSSYLVERYGERVHKVSLHSGLGCPNRNGGVGDGGCTFCAQPALQPVGFRAGQSIPEQLTKGMAYIRNRHGSQRFIAYYQDYSSTYAPAERLEKLYRPALEVPEIVGLAVSTRPDCLSPAVLDLLEAIARRRDLWVELGLQIADDRQLSELRRGHDVADFVRAVSTLHERSLTVCAHVILGLPGASAEAEQRTAALLKRLGVWGVKLHAFHVVAHTEMARRHAREPLPLLSLDEHADRVVDFVVRLDPSTVIHRVTAEAPPRLTVAPLWTTNKMAAFDHVVAKFSERDTWQGRLHEVGQDQASG